MEAFNPDQYIDLLSEAKKEVIRKIREILLENILPTSRKFSSWYLLSKINYSKGYHADCEGPLPFIHCAPQNTFLGNIEL
jgi:hypothetical protein